MTSKPWHGPKWPKGVPHTIGGYEKPLFSILDETTRQYPDRVFTIFAGASRTYAQVKDTADRVAHFLHTRGINPGDRVAVFLPNIPHYPPVFFGILKAGAVCITCNPLYKGPELHYQLKDSGARALFVMDHPLFYATVLEAIPDTDVETVVVCNIKSYLPPLKGFLGALLGKIPKADRHEPGHLMFDEVVRSARPEPPRVDIDPLTDPALILYTGGTTGVPKGAVLTHANMVFDFISHDDWVRIPHEEGGSPERMRKGGYHRYLGVLPWYHVFGLTCCMISSCGNGSGLVCVPDPRAGKPPFTEVLKAVQKYRVTVLPAVPTIYVAFNNHPLIRKFDLSSIMACFCGGAPMPVEAAKQFEAITGAVLFEGYGLTETAPVVAINPTNTRDRKFGSVGFPIANTDVKILDLETGQKELPQGEDGEIAVSGPQVMKGYWQRPEEDESAFREIEGNRYFLTGDIGHVDEEGFVIITDRKKDMILVGGFNAYPREIEEVLYTHPKVAQAAAVGVPDAKSGEIVKAYIQLKEGEEGTPEEFLTFCKDRMAGYKRPREIEFRDSLPTSAVGKVLRRVLRDEEIKKRKAS